MKLGTQPVKKYIYKMCDAWNGQNLVSIHFFLSKLVKTSKTEQKRLRVKVGKRPLFSFFRYRVFFSGRATRKPREVQTHSESIQDPLRTFYPRIDCILLFPNEGQRVFLLFAQSSDTT